MILFKKRRTLTPDQIERRLQSRLHFGLFDVHNDLGGAWTFEDGLKMKERDLWEALRVIHDLKPGHGKTLRQLCPDNYEGTFAYKSVMHKWSD